MAYGDFFLVSEAGDVIDLNSLESSITGVQAVAGLTGFGLPPVEVQYQVGAGDGATYRGQRLSPRDIDLPLFIHGASRADLVAQVNRVARAVAGECALRWNDGERLWELKVRRTGGGEYVHGEDTPDGGQSVRMTLSFRAEDPLWKTNDPYVVKLNSADITDGGMPVEIPATGNGKSYIKLSIHGPTLGFTVTSPRGEVVEYSAFVPDDETITIDFENGTVVGANGTNMYHGLAPAPRFFSVGPEAATIQIDVDRSSPAYTDFLTRPLATNFIRDPKFAFPNGNPPAGQTDTNWYVEYLEPNKTKRISFTNGKVTWTAGRTQHNHPNKAEQGMTPVPQARLCLEVRPALVFANGNTQPATGYFEDTGLTIGRQYDLMVNIASHTANWATPNHSYPHTRWMRLWIYDGSNTSYKAIKPGTTGWVKMPFTAQNENVKIAIEPMFKYNRSKRYGTGHGWFAVDQAPVSISQVALVESGIAYFDGDTADTTYRDYQWTTATTPDLPYSVVTMPEFNESATSIEVEHYPRNWMVI